MKSGFLGFPIYQASDDYHIGWHYDNAVDQWIKQAIASPVGTLVLDKLKQDQRVLDLEGKFVQGFSTPFRVDQLAKWWLFRANEAGTPVADFDVDNYLNGDEYHCLLILWVHGIQPQHSIDLFDGYSISPIAHIPDSTDKQKVLRSKWCIPESPIELALPTAAITRKHSIPKLIPDFDKLKKTASTNDDVRFPLYELCLLLNCMPNVTCIAGHESRRSQAHCPFGVIHCAASGSGHIMRDIHVQEHSGLVANNLVGFDVKLFRSLHLGFDSLNTTSRKRIERALTRLAQAKVRMNYQDAALDLGIALEMLLLNSEHRGDRHLDQLSLHFRLRGSWLIGADGPDRQRVLKVLRDIYMQRSKVAHNGFSEALDNLSQDERKVQFHDQFTVAEQIFRSLIINGQPNWTALILGDLTND